MARASLLVGALVVAGIFGVGALARDGEPAPRAVAETEAPAAVEHEHEAPLPEGADSAPALNAAREFMGTFADRPTTEPERAAWVASIDRLAAPELAEGLRWTEPERLPDAKVVDLRLLEVDDVSTAVLVDLDDGRSWVVTVETTAAGWLATDVRPEA